MQDLELQLITEAQHVHPSRIHSKVQGRIRTLHLPHMILLFQSSDYPVSERLSGENKSKDDFFSVGSCKDAAP